MGFGGVFGVGWLGGQDGHELQDGLEMREGRGLLTRPGASLPPGLLLQDKPHEPAGGATEHGPRAGLSLPMARQRYQCTQDRP